MAEGIIGSDLRRRAEALAARSLHFPALSADRRYTAFYTPLHQHMGLTWVDLRTGKVRSYSRAPLPTSTTVGLAVDSIRRCLIYAVDRSGDERYRLYAVDMDTESVTPVLTEPAGRWFVGSVSPDGRWLSLLSDRDGGLNVWRVSVDGGYLSPITRSGGVIGDARWSPDGRWLAVSMARGEGAIVAIITADGSEIRCVLDIAPRSVDLIAAWSPCARYLAFNSDARPDASAGILDLSDGSYHWLDAETEEECLGFSPSGRQILTVRRGGEGDSLVVHDRVSGGRNAVGEPGGQIVFAAFTDDSTVVAVGSRDTQPPRLLRYRLGNGTPEALYPGAAEPREEWFVKCQDTSYYSSDGTLVPALLYTPEHHAPGTSLPAAVILHGGPGDRFHKGFDPYAQFLVGLGLVVLEPNIRGSSGFGRAHQEAIRRAWGRVDLIDVLSVHGHLSTLPFVDPERIVLFGSSYGAFLAARAAASAPSLWRAAILWGGFYDIPALFDSSARYMRRVLRAEMGDPSQESETWRSLSPVAAAREVGCPLLLLHGQNDTRIPVHQARRFREALLQAGKEEGRDFRYVELPGEGHVHTDIDQSVRLHLLIAEFLADLGVVAQSDGRA